MYQSLYKIIIIPKRIIKKVQQIKSKFKLILKYIIFKVFTNKKILILKKEIFVNSLLHIYKHDFMNFT